MIRRSHSRVTAETPDHAELLALVEAAGGVADHQSLRPWRIIELRGAVRIRLGEAFVAAATSASADGSVPDAAKLAAKPLRAELLLAIVVAVQPSEKVPGWEQAVAASGVAHLLSLLLDEAGWAVMWRSGPLTRSEPVRAVHKLAANEYLLGWLYVGGMPERTRGERRDRIDPERFLSVL
ncbi:MAG: nitroreductase family protein [Microbacteriaceae bacterium]|nr:nitroreductase family protein [Microbacteriaceae bacterium]